MANPIEIVQNFFKAWEPAFAYRSVIPAWFTDDCVYENIGLTKSTGVAEAIAVLDSFNAMGFATLKVDMLAIAAVGNMVLTERVDHLCDAQGKVLMSLRLMGAFEVRGEKISGWRDYFDTAPFLSPKA